jgi:hypothetical protein
MEKERKKEKGRKRKMEKERKRKCVCVQTLLYKTENVRENVRMIKGNRKRGERGERV